MPGRAVWRAGRTKIIAIPLATTPVVDPNGLAECTPVGASPELVRLAYPQREIETFLEAYQTRDVRLEGY